MSETLAYRPPAEGAVRQQHAHDRYDREGSGHILVMKIKVPASFNQLISDLRSPKESMYSGSECIGFSFFHLLFFTPLF
jgi:hypothetical protein